MKVKFFLDKQEAEVDPEEEIVEFDDDTTPEQVQEMFTEWVFQKLDSAIIYLDDNGNPL